MIIRLDQNRPVQNCPDRNPYELNHRNHDRPAIIPIIQMVQVPTRNKVKYSASKKGYFWGISKCEHEGARVNKKKGFQIKATGSNNNKLIIIF